MAALLSTEKALNRVSKLLFYFSSDKQIKGSWLAIASLLVSKVRNLDLLGFSSLTGVLHHILRGATNKQIDTLAVFDEPHIYGLYSKEEIEFISVYAQFISDFLFLVRFLILSFPFNLVANHFQLSIIAFTSGTLLTTNYAFLRHSVESSIAMASTFWRVLYHYNSLSLSYKLHLNKRFISYFYLLYQIQDIWYS